MSHHFADSDRLFTSVPISIDMTRKAQQRGASEVAMAVSRSIKESIGSSSWIRKMFEEGLRLKKEFGDDNVYDFSIGNPDLPPPAKFYEVIERFAQERTRGASGYMPNAGFPDVRAKLAAKASAEQGVTLAAEHLVMTVGAAGGLNVTLKTLLNPGDEIIVPAPYFVEYGAYAANHGGVLVKVPTTADFSLDIAAIESAVTTKTAAVIINSPNNPTGRIYPAEQIQQLGEALQRASERVGRIIYLIADEPYREIVYNNRVVPPVLSAYPHSIVVTSYSKTLSLPGERIGYIAVNPACADFSDVMGGLIMCNRTLGFVNAPALMQRAVGELTDARVDVAAYERRKELLSQGLREAGYAFAEPEGAFYLFCKAPTDDDVAFVNHLKEHRVLAVPGSGFGGPGYFRLSYCVGEDTIARSLPAFKAALQSWK